MKLVPAEVKARQKKKKSFDSLFISLSHTLFSCNNALFGIVPLSLSTITFPIDLDCVDVLLKTNLHSDFSSLPVQRMTVPF